VKFVFDEAANQLTVSLISYRNLFVFRDNARFKPTIKGRTIRPDMLPYVVTFDPSEKYQISKLFKSTVPRPHKKFVFSRWIEYEHLQPAPQEYQMVNDFITQTFDIQKKETQVSVTLRDVMLMDDVSKKPTRKCYSISYGRDLYLQYQITILLNIHHIDLALQYCDRVIGVRAGEIVFDGPANTITQEQIDFVYNGTKAPTLGDGE
jgi:hypothetical protein